MAPTKGTAITDAALRSRLTAVRADWRDRTSVPNVTGEDLAYARIVRADPCSYCGNAGGEIEHINHNEHGWQNLTSGCRRCNTGKGQHTLLRYLLAKQLRAARDDAIAQVRALGLSHGSRTSRLA